MTHKPDAPTTDVVPPPGSPQYEVLRAIGVIEVCREHAAAQAQTREELISKKYDLLHRIIDLKRLLLDTLFAKWMRLVGVGLGAFLMGALISEKWPGKPMSRAAWGVALASSIVIFGASLWIEAKQTCTVLKEVEKKED